MIFTSVDLPAPFSPKSAWISAGHRSRSTASFASRSPKRLLMPTACSSGWRSPGRAGRPSMRGVARSGKVARLMRLPREGVAADQQLRGGGGGNRGRRLVADFGKPDRADKTLDRLARNAHLGHGGGGTRPRGG